MKQPNTNVEEFIKLLNFDPAKEPSPTADLFREVLEEETIARREIAKASFKKLMSASYDLLKAKKKLDQDYAKESKKFDENFGKLFKQIKAAAAGGEISEPSEGASANTEPPDMPAPAKPVL